MKSRMLIWGFAFLVTACLQTQKITLPPAVNLFRHPVTVSKSDHSLHGFHRVRMWGWSDTGNVAYSTERFLDGEGGWRIEFSILNTITNEEVFYTNIDTYEYDILLPLLIPYWDDVADFEAFEKKLDTYIKELYKCQMDTIKEAIKKNGIRESSSDFLPFPIQRNNTEYNCRIENIKRGDHWFLDRSISKYTVVITPNNQGKIIKTDENHRHAGIFGAVGLFICGYFVTPIENRILIVVAEERFVYEGSELFYVFIGCDLETGFN